MQNVSIQPFVQVRPMIYCYTTPGVTYHEGWVKIGYTEKQKASDRIAQQLHTPDIRFNIEWKEPAQYKDDESAWFTDHDFHNYLTRQRNVRREPGKEWFQIQPKKARDYFNDFADRKSVYKDDEHVDYQLRAEQEEAVRKTKEYFESGGEEFLWNAKPRFGKTLTAYDLIRQMRFKKVLVVTNRPSIANSWADDFNKFIGWRGELCFVSELDSIRNKKGVLTRDEFVGHGKVSQKSPSGNPIGFVEFESLQNLKGSVYFGGNFDKLEWLVAKHKDAQGRIVEGLTFDLLIVDEAHEGVDTFKTDRAFDNIARRHTLYLSGTPFKALADGRFDDDQIFNWTYVDEQEAKTHWSGESFNPYERLPRLAMFTYQLSNIITEKVQRGIDLDDIGNVDYAFDLNEFFATDENTGKFIHENDILKFLDALTIQEKYPFSSEKLRKELSHTLWLLDRVKSAKALARLLNSHKVFSEYEVVVAAGDGSLGEDDDKVRETSFNRVKKAIRENDKTITLSVGQLTVGVTIPEWSGVLMLCNMKSPSSYMQAAFRAQNPYRFQRLDDYGRPETFVKDTAYVFDFDPARTLVIFDEFANNLSPDTVGGRGTTEDRKVKIGKLLNFFPVLGEDSDGKMVELDAQKVLSIPRRLKSAEVVRRGFMSNFLFQNISNVFGAPAVVKGILEKLTPAHEEKISRKKTDPIENIEGAPVDKDGNEIVPNEIVIGKSQELFGNKVYEVLIENTQTDLTNIKNTSSTELDQLDKNVNSLIDGVIASVNADIISPVREAYKLRKSESKNLEKQISNEIRNPLAKLKDDLVQQAKIAETQKARLLAEAETEKDVESAHEACRRTIEQALDNFKESTQKTIDEIIKKTPNEVIKRVETNNAIKEKRSIEDSVRDHLRGFSRTIPSFIMAYGDEQLKLANFDEYTEDDVFKEVTGITEDDFRFLRDGGDYIDEATKQTEHFKGHLFDETVFDDSIKEFLKKKSDLADYFDEKLKEDIFDYIPPQKTNQIYTPRWVVEKMVDFLEEENPGCFDDPTKTFADLYMKSGLYIAEIVKRLYNSRGLKEKFPDKKDRIRHIMQNQVYGMAPSRIIYLIATNYILGFDEALKAETINFIQADAADAAKKGRLKELVDEKFGD